MKAICIDGKPIPESGITYCLPEGIPLDVYQHPIRNDHYLVSGYEYDPKDGVRCGWTKRRFVPLSSIDETQMIREYNKELV